MDSVNSYAVLSMTKRVCYNRSGGALMMTAVKAYYNGTTFVPLQRYNFKPSQQVLIVVDEKDDLETPAQKFLKLSWAGNESADEILKTINSSRNNSTRFGAENALFD